MCVHVRGCVRACVRVRAFVCVFVCARERRTSRASSAKASFADGLLNFSAEAAAMRASLRRGVRVLREGPRASAERNGGACASSATLV